MYVDKLSTQVLPLWHIKGKKSSYLVGYSKGRLQLPDDVLDNKKHIPIIFLKACVPLPTFFTHFPFLAGFILTDHEAPLTCSASKLVTAQSLKWELRCRSPVWRYFKGERKLSMWWDDRIQDWSWVWSDHLAAWKNVVRCFGLLWIFFFFFFKTSAEITQWFLCEFIESVMLTLRKPKWI